MNPICLSQAEINLLILYAGIVVAVLIIAGPTIFEILREDWRKRKLHKEK